MAHRNITTLIYIEKDNKYLMLHRVKKENDMNKDKWLGVGGHLEDNESPDECAVRETFEETGLTLTDYRLRGFITFVSNEWPTEYMCLYTATAFTGELTQCNEGTLEWVPKTELRNLNLWEGDYIFLDMLESSSEFFTLKLEYEGDKLVRYEPGRV